MRIFVLFALLLSNVFEWYSYSLFSSYGAVLATLYFPPGSDSTHLMESSLIITVGLVAKIAGGFIFGYICDAVGRKSALKSTIIVSAMSSICVAILPTYSSIGLYATVSLIVLRILAGLASGGEVGALTSYIMEDKEASKHRGFWSGVKESSYGVGYFVASGMVSLFAALLTNQQLMQWGFRIPFGLCATGVVVVLWMRRTIPEGMVLEERTSIREFFQDIWAARISVIKCILAIGAPDSQYYLMTTFVPNYLHVMKHKSISYTSTLASIGTLLYIILVIFFGYMSDKIGRKKQLIAASMIQAIFMPLLMNDICSGLSGFGEIIYVIAYGFTAMSYAPLYAFLAEAFPAESRGTCISTTINASGVIFAGSVLFIAQSVISKFHEPIYVGLYLSFLYMITFSVLLITQDHSNKKLF